MRISDWSSDVCSSDHADQVNSCLANVDAIQKLEDTTSAATGVAKAELMGRIVMAPPSALNDRWRSVELRVGKERVSTFGSRWWPDHEKRNNRDAQDYKLVQNIEQKNQHRMRRD